VTLVDSREDYGAISKEDLSKNHRSWMIGLAPDHKMDAFKTLPELYHNYVKGEGVRVTKFGIYIGKKKFSLSGLLSRWIQYQTLGPIINKFTSSSQLL